MDDEDRALFRQAMRGVRRLRLPVRQAGPRPRLAPRARFTRMERAAVLHESLAGAPSPLDPVVESGDALLFRRASISETIFRKLRAGQYRVDGEIDLHGLIAADVEPALRAFLAEAMQQDARVVRVVHGKGRRSGHRGPVLKLVASRYLQRVGAVLAFASAREVDGGSGAILVLLAERRPQHQPSPQR
ncbi:MAG: Smr/MutS family protein [Steroidobacteraceae bacterium]